VKRQPPECGNESTAMRVWQQESRDESGVMRGDKSAATRGQQVQQFSDTSAAMEEQQWECGDESMAMRVQ